MARRDANRPQLDFPELVADLISDLRLTGTVGLLDFSDQVAPVFLIGSRGVNFAGDLPTFNSASVFDGAAASPSADTIIADTGPLPAGVYDMFINMEFAGQTGIVISNISCQHRNAANNTTLATFMRFMVDTDPKRSAVFQIPRFAYEIALNERIRIKSPPVIMTAGFVSGAIFARIRPTP